MSEKPKIENLQPAADAASPEDAAAQARSRLADLAFGMPRALDSRGAGALTSGSTDDALDSASGTRRTPKLPSDGSMVIPKLPSDGSTSAPRLPSDGAMVIPKLPTDGSTSAPRLPSDGAMVIPKLPTDGSTPAPKLPSDGAMVIAKSPTDGSTPAPKLPSDGAIVIPKLPADGVLAASKSTADGTIGMPRLPGTGGDGGVGAKKELPLTPSEFLPSIYKHIEGAQTVVFVDTFHEKENFVAGDRGFSHGDLSARMAAENGFNVVRLQSAERGNKLKIEDALHLLNGSLNDGTVKLSPNDIVNISAGLQVPFEHLSRLVKFEVTAENVREKRQEILNAAAERLKSPQTSQNDRMYLTSMVKTAAEIQRLQERGITVVSSGGNEGPNSVNIAMLAADKQFSAVKPDGTFESWSANNSLTTPGLGEVQFSTVRLNMFDSTPFAEQKGIVSVAGSNIKLSGEEFGGLFQITPLDSRSNPDVMRRMMSPDFSLTDDNVDGFDSKSWIAGSPGMYAEGTSFVNVFELPKEAKRIRDEKRDAQ